MTRTTAKPAEPELGSLPPVKLTRRRAASVRPGAIRSEELEDLEGLTRRARTAFEVAREAFLRLEAAHHENRPGTEENAMFLAKVALFRRAADAVHEAARRRRGSAPPMEPFANGGWRSDS